MKTRIIIFLCVALFGVNSANAQFFKFLKKKQNTKKTAVVAKPKLSEYEKLIKGTESAKGLISIYKKKEKKEDKIYFEIPASLLGKHMLFASKIAESSDMGKAYTGQMQTMRYLTIEREGNNIFFNNAVSKNLCDNELTISKSFEKNNITTHLEMFPIKAKSSRDSSFVIDVTKFLMATKEGMGMPKNKPFQMKPNGSFTLQKNMSGIKDFQAFSKNINVRCKLCFKAGTYPVSIVANRSFVLLPEEPMKPRMNDARLNYFPVSKFKYDEKQYGSEKIKYITRWNIFPKAEDIEKFKAGELVEPEKPIIWYIDDAVPAKWRKYIKQGIEDWQKAFEAIGFKNAIVAKDFPKNDPDFNPEDISYNCFRYVTMPIANAMGPSWIDPRSGEIIHATVYFCHDVFKLAKNWRFVQTAAVDPEARKKEMSVEAMGALVRNIAAHEIGHTLGLMHNFRASYAFPVDSLRSASFTQKYGNTASIMDYTRYNYIAQPGDKGVRLTPPDLGLYDMFSIKLGYTPIFNTTSEEEYDTINKWILDKADNPAYIFGPQPKLFAGIGSPPDPASQSSDLGNDAMKAGKYGIKNLKYIMNHLLEWTEEEGHDYKYTSAMYREVRIQFYKYIQHAVAYIGGTYLYDPVAGDNQRTFVPVSKKKQKEALKFVFDEVRDLENWIHNDKVDKILYPGANFADFFQRYLVDKTTALGTLDRLYNANSKVKNGYSIDEYLNDVYCQIWEPTRKGKKLNDTDRRLQYFYIVHLWSRLGVDKNLPKSAKRFAFSDDYNQEYDVYNTDNNEKAFAGRYDDRTHKIEGRRVFYSQLKKVKNLLERAIKVTVDRKTKQHYEYLYSVVQEAI